MKIFDRIRAKDFLTKLRDKNIISAEDKSKWLDRIMKNEYPTLPKFYKAVIVENKISYEDLLNFDTTEQKPLIKEICLTINDYLMQIRAIDARFYDELIEEMSTEEIESLSAKVRKTVAKDITANCRAENSKVAEPSTIKIV